MNLAVVGASGRTGRHVVEQASSQGHQVTAIVRDLAKASAAASTVQLDLAQATADEVAAAVSATDVVLSCLGPANRADVGIATTGTARILAGMAVAGVDRLVVISAAPVAGMPFPGHPYPSRPTGEDPLTRVLLTPLLRRALRSRYTDLAAMEDLLRTSTAAWTVVRPARLTNAPYSGQYRTRVGANLPYGRSISRPDLAHLMLQLPSMPHSIRQPVAIAY